MNAIATRGRPRKKYTGDYGPLTVIATGLDVVLGNGQNRTTVICRCLCGREVTIRTDCLRFYKDKTDCRCGFKRGRPPSPRVIVMLDALLAGKTNHEMMEEFNISHQYVSILRKRLANL